MHETTLLSSFSLELAQQFFSDHARISDCDARFSSVPRGDRGPPRADFGSYAQEAVLEHQLLQLERSTLSFGVPDAGRLSEVVCIRLRLEKSLVPDLARCGLRHAPGPAGGSRARGEPGGRGGEAAAGLEPPAADGRRILSLLDHLPSMARLRAKGPCLLPRPAGLSC